MGAAAVGATIYFGSDQSDRADRGGESGLRSRARTGDGHDFVVLLAQRIQKTRTPLSADLMDRPSVWEVPSRPIISKASGEQRWYQAPHGDSGYAGSTSASIPILQASIRLICRSRCELLHGRAGLSTRRSVRATIRGGSNHAVINKRAGGTGLISGRKAFNGPLQKDSIAEHIPGAI